MTIAFNAALSGFKNLYDAGKSRRRARVGYPNPNRSHFPIHGTSGRRPAPRIALEKYGWLGRYFDNACAGADPTVGVTIGSQLPQAFFAKQPNGICLNNPQKLSLHVQRPSETR